jgi:hypothetical protein
MTDQRLAEASEDQAIDIGHEWLRAERGSPVGLVAERLMGGGYLVRIAWQTQAGVGGRRGRKRWQNHSREILPPGRSRDERIKESTDG